MLVYFWFALTNELNLLILYIFTLRNGLAEIKDLWNWIIINYNFEITFNIIWLKSSVNYTCFSKQADDTDLYYLFIDENLVFIDANNIQTTIFELNKLFPSIT